MANIVVGCAGWDYADWVGPFYPRKLAKTDQLAHYAKFFDFVEVNSSFYQLPTHETLVKWGSVVPDHFRFSVKIWNRITHTRDTENLETRVSSFFGQLKVLEPKIACYLLQFPPRFKHTSENYVRVRHLLETIPTSRTVVVELRDNSWFVPDLLDKILDADHHILGVSYIPGYTPVYRPGQARYYIRCVGDRQLTVFNKIQRKQEPLLTEVEKKIHDLSPSDSIRDIFIIFNNHFTGFSPETANEFKRRVGLPARNFTSQKTLFDFYRK